MVVCQWSCKGRRPMMARSHLAASQVGGGRAQQTTRGNRRAPALGPLGSVGAVGSILSCVKQVYFGCAPR